MVAQYIATQKIMDLGEETVRMTGMRVAKRLWDQEGMDLSIASAESVSEEE